jgi:hypothetical protein
LGRFTSTEDLLLSGRREAGRQAGSVRHEARVSVCRVLLKAAAAGGGRGSFYKEGREGSKARDSRVNDVLIKKIILKSKLTEVDCVVL